MTNIGVFDSGVGGLSILKGLVSELSRFNYIYYADQINIPYGEKSVKQIQEFSENIVRFLIDKNCRVIVIACNSASSASLKYLREIFPHIIFVGMEPAIKKGYEITKNKNIGVMATQATLQGELYKNLILKYGQGIKISENNCNGLVRQVENNELNSEMTKSILEKILQPMIEDNIDTLVLGCTHYPFLIRHIREIVGDEIMIIDPTDAIVNRVKSLAVENEYSNSNIEIFTSSQVSKINIIVQKLFNKDIKVSYLLI